MTEEALPAAPASDDEPTTSEVLRTQRALLSHIRHELRTPINAIIGYSEMLLEVASELGGERHIPDLQKIHFAGEQLLALVNDILDPAKIDSQRDLDLKDFGAHIRHAMRTPINTVIGYCEMLIEDADDGCGEAFIPDVNRILTSGQRLTALIEDIVNLSKIEAGKEDLSHLERSDVSDLIREVVTTIRPLEEDACSTEEKSGSLLVVDDNETNRDMLSRRLRREGYTVAVAEDGRRALEMLQADSFDLVLLDIVMPEMNGYQVLEHVKSDDGLRHIPVIMLSSLNEIDSIVRCIEMGAEDYLPKPFNPVLLRARITSCLEKKRLRDREQAYLEQLRVEREKSEGLLLNVLPKPIADRLKQGESPIVDSFPESTVLFADLVGFTPLSARMSPKELLALLNEIFSAFDRLAEQYRLEKIKTVGDAYMIVGGLPTPRPDHAEAVAEMALDMLAAVARINSQNDSEFRIRIGINSGPVVAGVIGTKKFIYDLWGDTVNTASRMESHGLEDNIHVTSATYERLRDKYLFEERGVIQVKGKGEMVTYFLQCRKGQD